MWARPHRSWRRRSDQPQTNAWDWTIGLMPESDAAARRIKANWEAVREFASPPAPSK